MAVHMMSTKKNQIAIRTAVADSGNLPGVANRIKELREAKKWSQPELARRVIPPTSSQQIGRLEKGERGLKQEWLEKLAKALDCSPSDLLPPQPHGARRRQVPLVGYIGAGELYYADPEAGDWAGCGFVEARDGASDHEMAVKVRGNDLRPAYGAGDLLFFEKASRTNPADWLGKHCVVQPRTGRGCIKLVLAAPGLPGRYLLRSVLRDVMRGEPDMPDVDILWAARIRGVQKA